jgi:multisubunit Na+/H+ antiporter MnhE subunit
MPSPVQGHARHVIAAELLAWWTVAVGVWMASLSAYSGQDLVVAMACAVPCGAAAVAARRVVRGAWRLPVDALGWLVALPAAMIADAGRVLTWPLRPRAGEGEFRTIDVAAAGDTASSAGRRAAAAFLLSSTPGTYVVSADEERGTLLVHALSAPSSLERRLSR